MLSRGAALEREHAHYEQQDGPEQPSERESDDVRFERNVGAEGHESDGKKDGGEQDANPAGDTNSIPGCAPRKDVELVIEPASDKVPEQEHEGHGAEERAEVGAEVKDFGEECAEHGGRNVNGDGNCPGERHDEGGLRMAFGQLALLISGLSDTRAEGVAGLNGSDRDQRDEQHDVCDRQNAPEAESAEHGGHCTEWEKPDSAVITTSIEESPYR